MPNKLTVALVLGLGVAVVHLYRRYLEADAAYFDLLLKYDILEERIRTEER